MTKINNLIKLENYINRTKDGLWTYNDLLNKILKMIHRVNTTKDSDMAIRDFIEKSFVPQGIIEVYDDCGYYGWCQIVQRMIESEIYERNTQTNE